MRNDCHNPGGADKLLRTFPVLSNKVPCIIALSAVAPGHVTKTRNEYRLTGNIG